MLRFSSPLIKPDVPISGIRLSDRLHREAHGGGPTCTRRRRNTPSVIATTDSDHNGPIFPNLAKDLVPSGPNQLWVSDITYVALPARFVYVAVILDAWSRLIVGYAVGRSIDARLTMAALKAAIDRRQPSPGCVHHSDRGSQYAAEPIARR